SANCCKSYTHDDRFVGFAGKKRKGRGPFRAKMSTEGPHNYRKGGYGPNPRSRFEDEGGDIAMTDTYELPYSRFAPYGRGGRRRDDRGGYMKGKRHVDLHSDGPSHKKIPHGKKYEQSWLINVLQKACSVPFTPIEYYCDHSRAHFYVDDANTARALKRISRTLTDSENFKVFLKVESTLSIFFPEQSCMQKRYDGSQLALDMKSLHNDPDLLQNHVDMMLNRRSCMLAMLQIIEENVPELLSLDLSNNDLLKLDDLRSISTKAPNLKILNLSHNSLKTDRELDKIKGLKIEQLWLEGNPLCQTFRDKTLYISAVRERFPKLLQLDGQELVPPINFDVETPTLLPPTKGSYLQNDEIKGLVLRFLQQYFTCYDGEDRQGLLNVYHDEACCSLCIPYFQGQNPSRSSLGEYFKDCRNLKKLKDPSIRHKLLKHKRLNIVGFLNELPRTQHDLNSFVVDITAASNTQLCFVVNGIFKEVEGPSRDPVRAFSPLCMMLLVNDGIFIRNATTEEIRKAFATPAPTPSSSPVPVMASVPQDMVQAFIQLSGMNAEWSQKAATYTLCNVEWWYLKLEGSIFYPL
uniref:NTF2 domain-containing protein n=1 Tax=Leptobrachium leishanense TaxID=445787 RepID=A0A8C5WIQ4_9ANUR